MAYDYELLSKMPDNQLTIKNLKDDICSCIPLIMRIAFIKYKSFHFY